ncbi:hypothetical protein Desor_3479 [Desulfosporosinus orientis DSM 765]|uniref:Uncharacterized protein n=2 Tax=Desulfosporosinus orientis TaxID=1563 RepID=G7WGV4_DESOD|nr:hypothetical protein Desor_3479 [Desulfosporosinus orientis DSM 765]
MLSNLNYYDSGYYQDGVGLLTSILMRYSEVGSVHYWREEHALKFTFMVEQIVDVTELYELLKPALEFFHKLEGLRMRLFDIKCRTEESICVVTITRDLSSMTQREVGLIVELLKGKYKKHMIFDELYLPKDEQIYQEEQISQMLTSIKTKDINKNIIALRDEGKVLVFKTQ